MARKLRLAVSAFFGLLTLLLVVMWVRSYRGIDRAKYVTSTTSTSFYSCTGLMFYDTGSRAVSEVQGWTAGTSPGVQWNPAEIIPAPLTYFHIHRHADGLRAVLPYKFAASIIAVATIVPWLIPRSTRFSLRTLLIATTLLAMAIGFAVWVGI